MTELEKAVMAERQRCADIAKDRALTWATAHTEIGEICAAEARLIEALIKRSDFDEGRGQ